MRDLLASIHRACDREGTRTPSRATVYKLLGTTPCERLRVADLPAEVQAALYNFTGASEVPAHQVVHACFDHGSAPALSFASGLPWLALHQARKMRGLRPRGRGLLEAVCRARGI